MGIATSILGGGLFGGGGDDINVKPPKSNVAEFTAGGISTVVTPGKKKTPTLVEVFLDPESERATLTSDLSQVFADQAAELAALRGLVSPGFGEITKAGVDALTSEKLKTAADLEGSLARRNVLGSSFGQASVAASNAEFAQKEAEFKAEAFLLELEATNSLLNQETQALANSLIPLLEQENLLTEIGFQTALAATEQLTALTALNTDIAIAEAEAAAAELAGLGSLAGAAAGIALFA